MCNWEAKVKSSDGRPKRKQISPQCARKNKHSNGCHSALSSHSQTWKTICTPGTQCSLPFVHAPSKTVVRLRGFVLTLSTYSNVACFKGLSGQN